MAQNLPLRIRPMLADDLGFAAERTATEGWASETRREFEGFLAYDPQGCFVAQVGEQRVGIGIATRYGRFGFVGELIVRQEARGLGVGRQILEHAIGYLQANGVRTIFLDGVLKAVPLYERVGFQRICRSLRFTGQMAGRSHPEVRPMLTEDLEAVARLDRQAFGAGRRFFLERRRALYPELCQVICREGRVTGFIFGRRGQDVVAVGPWIVSREVEQPGKLLESVAQVAGETLLAIGTLETNQAAVSTLRAFGLAENPLSPWRMVLGEPGQLGGTPEAYAIGSAAQG